MLSKQAFTAVLALFLLTAMLMPWEAFGQADSLEVEIVWQKELDSGIKLRGNLGVLEPDVGIDLSVSEGKSPIRAVATVRSVYIFDEQGNVKQQISLRLNPVPNDVPKDNAQEFINEYARISPKGQFYSILTSTSTGYTVGYTDLRVFDIDGNLKFELNRDDLISEGLRIALPYIPPNGDFMVLFHADDDFGRYPFVDFYDLHGNLRKHIDLSYSESFPFSSPFLLGFSNNGQQVAVWGFKTDIQIIYDAWGNELDRVKVVEDKARKADKALAASMKGKLEAKLPEGHLNEQEEHRLVPEKVKVYPERGLGIYSRGKTLYLFRLKQREKKL